MRRGQAHRPLRDKRGERVEAALQDERPQEQHELPGGMDAFDPNPVTRQFGPEVRRQRPRPERVRGDGDEGLGGVADTVLLVLHPLLDPAQRGLEVLQRTP